MKKLTTTGRRHERAFRNQVCTARGNKEFIDKFRFDTIIYALLGAALRNWVLKQL